MIRGIQGVVGQFTPSLNLDFMQGVMPSGLTYTGSNGTRVNAQGWIESLAANTPRFDYDPTNVTISGQNLLLQSSNLLNAAWNPALVTASQDGTLAPDGSLATKVVNTDGAFNGRGLFQNFSGGQGSTITLSTYVKAGQWNRVQIQTSGGAANSGFGRAFFDLSTGTVYSTVSGTNSIVAVGGGWFRISVTTSSAFYGTTTIQLAASGTSTITAPDGVGGIYFANPQINEGSTALPYTPTTTAAIAGTRTATALKGLLIEESRQNTLLWSGDFSNAVWGKTASGTGITPTVTANYSIAPNGTVSATRLQMDRGTGTTATDFVRINQVPNIIGNSSHSVWIRSNTAATYQLTLLMGGIGVSTLCAVTPTWTRFSASYTGASSASSWNLFLYGNVGGSQTVDISIWGGQAEPGSFPTSYIPTTSASITRSADNLNPTNLSWFNKNEGSFMLEIDLIGNGVLNSTGYNGILQMDILNFIVVSNSTTIRWEGPSRDIYKTTSSLINRTKFAGTYGSGPFSAISGGTVSTLAAASTTTPTFCNIGRFLGSYLNGHFCMLRYYPKQLSNQYFQSLIA